VVALVHYALKWCLERIMVNYGHRDTEAHETRLDQLFCSSNNRLKSGNVTVLITSWHDKSHVCLPGAWLLMCHYLPVRTAT